MDRTLPVTNRVGANAFSMRNLVERSTTGKILSGREEPLKRQRSSEVLWWPRRSVISSEIAWIDY